MSRRRARSQIDLSAWIDKALTKFAPGLQKRRIANRFEIERSKGKLEIEKQLQSLVGDRLVRKLKRSYDGAATTPQREQRWLVSGLSPDEGLDEDLETMQARCASLYRNSTVAHAAVETRVANEVGIGIYPQSKMKVELFGSMDLARQANKTVEQNIARWSRAGVDEKRSVSLPNFQRAVVRSLGTFGEAFVFLGQSRGDSLSVSLQLISPERVKTPPGMEGDPSVVLGVKFEGNLPVGYYVNRTHPGDNRNYEDYEYVPRYNKKGVLQMVHCYDQELPEQSRGAPWMHSCMDRIKDLDDYFEAELLNKQVEACFGLIVQKRSDLYDGPESYAESVAAETLSSGQRVEDWSPGSVEYLNEGEEVKTIDPNRPGATFVPFVDKSLRTIAAALNLPYECLAKDFFRTTFSSGRLAMLDGRTSFQMRQQLVIDRLLVPLYEHLFSELVLVGSLPITPAVYELNKDMYLDHSWRGQGWTHIDPEKETRADRIALKNGTTTLAGIAQSHGDDWEEIKDQSEREQMREIEKEVRLAVFRRSLFEEAGLDIEEEEAQSVDDSNE